MISHLGGYFYHFFTKVKQKQDDNKDEAQMMIRPLTDSDYDRDA